METPQVLWENDIEAVAYGKTRLLVMSNVALLTFSMVRRISGH
jgi:hypothetical protein